MCIRDSGMDVNPYAFAVSRILDTLIGIGVSLGVNAFHLPHHKNRDLLFVCDLDGTLLHSDGAQMCIRDRPRTSG